MNHTPGPWRAIQQVTENWFVLGNADKANHVATVWHKGRAKSGSTHPETAEANARLIAAAPDLQAALEELVRDGYSEENEERAIAAIAKAKGE